MGLHLGVWEPLRTGQLATLMEDVDVPWWLAGGWALDLHLGRQTRDHADIDVLVLRPHLDEVRRRLADWDVHVADPPGTLRPWSMGEPFPDSAHDVWCRSTSNGAWQLQLMVDDVAVDGEWTYRRDRRIRRPLRELSGPASTPHLPLLAPEMQLLYKSRSLRPKDEADFRAVQGALDAGQRLWLREALSTTDPDHPWREALL
jgi:hypothetical protein